jgi:hypothetical protein
MPRPSYTEVATLLVGLTGEGLWQAGTDTAAAHGEIPDVVAGHRGVTPILDGPVVPVSGALYHRRVLGA